LLRKALKHIFLKKKDQISSMPSKREKERLKKALTRIRKDKLKKLDQELEQSIDFKKACKRAQARIEKMAHSVFSNKPEQLAYEMLCHICDELLTAKKRHAKLLNQIIKTLQKDFLSRKISAREYRYMAGPIKNELAEVNATIDELEKCMQESLEALKMFKKVPSFVSANHDHERNLIREMLSERFYDIFKEEKIEHLKELENEIKALYGITEDEITKAFRRARRRTKEALLDLREIEKKAKRAIMLAEKLSHGLQFECEKERAIEIIAELRKHIKAMS
jgi:hypothetical protein